MTRLSRLSSSVAINADCWVISLITEPFKCNTTRWYGNQWGSWQRYFSFPQSILINHSFQVEKAQNSAEDKKAKWPYTSQAPVMSQNAIIAIESGTELWVEAIIDSPHWTAWPEQTANRCSWRCCHRHRQSLHPQQECTRFPSSGFSEADLVHDQTLANIKETKVVKIHDRNNPKVINAGTNRDRLKKPNRRQVGIANISGTTNTVTHPGLTEVKMYNFASHCRSYFRSHSNFEPEDQSKWRTSHTDTNLFSRSLLRETFVNG